MSTSKTVKTVVRILQAVRDGAGQLAEALEREPDEVEVLRGHLRDLARLAPDVAALQQEVRGHTASLKEHAARVADDRHLIDLLREWARTEGDARTLSLEARTGGTLSDIDRATVAARKAGGQ